MKLHRPVAEQIISALSQIFGATEDGRQYYADKVIERIFKHNRKLGARDRRLIAESTYDIVRWWRLLWTSIGLDQPMLVDKEIWRVLGAWLLLGGNELPDWPEFKTVTREILEKNREKVRGDPAIRESIPDWMQEIGSRELGERWTECMAALNKPAPVVIRANRLKVNREHLRGELKHENVSCDVAPGTDDGLILTERQNVFSTECFKLGYFELQDGASQQASIWLDPQPGERVIDGCAGAGGKTLHMAALMKNKGKIIALDIYQHKLEELRKRCARDGVDIVEARLIDSAKTIKRMKQTADKVLLDVPCSGLGVLRRNPDAKWKLALEEVDRLRALQTEILESYSDMVKPGGRLVYATCSVLPSENSEQVEKFLAAHPRSWRLLDSRQFWPGENGYDGFYVALLERSVG